MRKIVDVNLGISNQAMAILHILKDYDGNFKDLENLENLETVAWYDGRERGICIIVVKNWEKDGTLYITFGENRSSDNIFVDHWLPTETLINPPTPTNKSKKAYDERKYFNFGEIRDTVMYINDLINEFTIGREEEIK